jgi:hypothetical protein
MNIFKELASQVDQIWAKEKNNLSAFTAIATEALKNFNYDWSLEKLDAEVQKWLLKNATLPQQMSLHNSFGQPSITVFNNNRFVVDLYFWVDFDTSIHSHGFRGAFRLLHGESLQENFRVKTSETVSESIMLVDLSDVSFKRLTAGDTQPIAPGLQLTHRVVHLANPTITLCLKTVNEPDLKQWNYLSSGLAMERQVMTVELAKKIYFYQYLLAHDRTQADSFLIAFLNELSISAQVLVYETAANRALDLNENTIDLITETIIEKHESSAWWPPYEKAHFEMQDAINFKHLQKPLERLVAHFTNCGYDLAQIQKIYDASIDDINRILKTLA